MQGTWTVATIGEHPADVYEPSGTARPGFGLVFLHGTGGETLRGLPAFTQVLDELNLPCVCPSCGLSWWADRLCPEFDRKITAEQHLLLQVVPFMQERFGIAPPRIGLVGISMGGQGALRLALKHPTLFPAVAGIASAIEYHQLYGEGTPLDGMYDSKEQCRQDTAPMHINPHQPPPAIFFACDPDDAYWYRGNDRLHEKLGALGAAHECDLTTEAGGHSWNYFNAMAERAIRFVHAGLLQQTRRLL